LAAYLLLSVKPTTNPSPAHASKSEVSKLSASSRKNRKSIAPPINAQLFFEQ
jgi:hypothetical protein